MSHSFRNTTGYCLICDNILEKNKSKYCPKCKEVAKNFPERRQQDLLREMAYIRNPKYLHGEALHKACNEALALWESRLTGVNFEDVEIRKAA